MCTWILHRADIRGSGKGQAGWFPIQQANVAFDHPADAPLDHAVLIDFVNEAMGPSARVAVELSATSARALVEAIQSALEDGDKQHVANHEDVVTLSVHSTYLN
ncbi:MAG: hypothetical protein HY534_07335 [Chloroflexi bacterium]|nr:hypothetical protein [Chloroflexota bacterium]